MSVMGFQKKFGWGVGGWVGGWVGGFGWVGGVSSIQVYFGFLQFVLTLQSPLICKI